jgi:hypothetical protein
MTFRQSEAASLELTRFRGHRNICVQGVHDGEDETTLVPVGNSRSDILVMQPAQDGYRQCLADGLDGAVDRRIFLQG